MTKMKMTVECYFMLVGVKGSEGLSIICRSDSFILGILSVFVLFPVSEYSNLGML